MKSIQENEFNSKLKRKPTLKYFFILLYTEKPIFCAISLDSFVLFYTNTEGQLFLIATALGYYFLNKEFIFDRKNFTGLTAACFMLAGPDIRISSPFLSVAFRTMKDPLKTKSAFVKQNLDNLTFANLLG